MEWILPVFTGLCLSAVTGFRAFLPPFILGLLYKFLPEYVQINSGFAFLASDPVLAALGVAVLIEFLGDKIPWVDHLLDQINLPAKFIFSGILTFALIPGDQHWFYLLVALVFAETATLTVHAGKTGVRMSSTAATGGLGNPIIGIIEDVVTLAASLAAILFPFIAIVLLALIIYKSLKFLLGKKGGNDGKFAEAQPSVWLYRLSAYGSYYFFKIYNRFTVTGQENIPEKGPFVIVANHASVMDGFILAGASKRELFIMVKKEAFENPFSGWYLRKVLSFPVDRSKPDSQAIRKAMKILNDGNNLGIFPEGTRNLEGKVSEFKAGAIRFATKKRIPIIPAYIGGSHLLTPEGKSFPRPAKMCAAFMKPIDTKAELEAGRTEEDLLDMIYEQICKKGTELMGYDVRDYESLDAAKHASLKEKSLVKNSNNDQNPEVKVTEGVADETA